MTLHLFKEKFKEILPASSSPKDDELISSWLVRLAQAHYMKPHAFCKMVLPNEQIWNRDIDRCATDTLVRKISNKVFISSEDIKQCLLSSYEGILFLNHNKNGLTRWILPLGIFHRKRLKNGLLYCPNCLSKNSNDPYFKKKWRLSLSVVCPTCKCLLIESCPSCHSPIIFFRTGIGRKNKNPLKPIDRCFNCDFDLKSSPISSIGEELLAMQNNIYTVLEGNDERYLYPFQYFDVLYQLVKVVKNRNLAELIYKDCLKETKLSPVKTTLNTRIPFDYLPIKERIPILFSAYWLLEDWPDRFLYFCKSNRLWSALILKDFENAPFWFYDTVISSLYVSNVNRRFGELKELISRNRII